MKIPRCAFCGCFAPCTLAAARVQGWILKSRRDGVMFLFCPRCLGRLGLSVGAGHRGVK